MEWVARTCCYCVFTYIVQEIFAYHRLFIGICKHYTVCQYLCLLWNIIIIIIIVYFGNGYI